MTNRHARAVAIVSLVMSLNPFNHDAGDTRQPKNDDVALMEVKRDGSLSNQSVTAVYLCEEGIREGERLGQQCSRYRKIHPLCCYYAQM